MGILWWEGIPLAGKAIAVRIGDVQVLAETVPVAGSELTSGKADKAAEHVLGAFERAQAAIVEVASSTVATVRDAAKRGARPDRMEVEFGVKFTVSGDVVIAGASAEASLLVRLTYERAGHDDDAE